MANDNDIYNIFGISNDVIINQNFEFFNKQFKHEFTQDKNVLPSL